MVQVIRLNGQVIDYSQATNYGPLDWRHVWADESSSITPMDVMNVKTPRALDRAIGHLRRNKRAYAMVVYCMAVMMLPGSAEAAGGMGGGKSLIMLFQQGCFWVGMGLTIWGIIEAQVGWPNWQWRILKGVGGYIGVLLVPLLFLELRDTLQVDVWNQIDASGGMSSQPGGVRP